MRILGMVASLLMYFAAGAAFADELMVNFDQANPPFMFSRNGNATGVYPSIIAAAFKKMNVPVSLGSVPWTRAIADADQGKSGVAGIYRNAEREKKYDFSEQIFVERLSIYFSKTKAINFNSVDDLKGLRIGVIRGWSYGEAFDAARKNGVFTVDEVASDEQNFGKLKAGRLDAVVAVAETGAKLLETYTTLAVAPTPLAKNPTFLAFGKSANLGPLLKKFNASIQELKTSGELEKIIHASLQ